MKRLLLWWHLQLLGWRIRDLRSTLRDYSGITASTQAVLRMVDTQHAAVVAVHFAAVMQHATRPTRWQLAAMEERAEALRATLSGAKLAIPDPVKHQG